jgi:hypothetical protein
MLKQIIVYLRVIILLLMAVMAMAEIPPTCPDCIVTCEAPVIPACPSLTCAENIMKVEGLWEVTTNKKLCGEIVLGPSWVIIGNETLMLNKVKKMVLVESCN